MDAQRLENLMVSMIADNATQAGGDGIPVVDVDMIPGPLATHWAERNKKRPAFLPMVSLKNKNGDITAQAQVSSYTPSTQMPPALAGLLQYTGTAIQQITGASQLENMPSNVATDTVDSIFNRMDTQSYIYMDNMAKSMRRAGVVWLSMAREVYGSDTPMRIVNEDGSDDVALMTGEVVDRQTGQVIALNDLSQGNYEVTVDVGQSFAINRRSFWNPFNYKDLAGELGHRAYAQGATLTAYEKAQIPPVASFDSYKTDISGRLPKGSAESLTVSGQPEHKVEAKDSNGMPVDNRQGTITVSASGLQIGDAFTIAGVNSVHQITKDTTGQPQVFRVLAVSGTTVTISPKILPVENTDVASRPYANVDAKPAASAAITILNKNAAPAICA